MIDLFIFAYLLLCFAWDLRQDHPLKRLMNKIGGIVRLLGLNHNWKMFSQPRTSNQLLVARVLMSDGSFETWYGCDYRHKSWWQAFLTARQPKWESNVARGNHNLPQAQCEHLLRMYRELGSDPIRIQLGLAERRIPAVGDTSTSTDEETRTLLHEYEVPQPPHSEIPPPHFASEVAPISFQTTPIILDLPTYDGEGQSDQLR